MESETIPAATLPVATYRLQFNRDFTFAAARDIVPYLHQLGIGAIYASSFMAAKEGSMHGYDVVSHTRLNEEIGSQESLQELVEELQRFGMGQILDFVPNHMCIESSDNAWWMDVLENGPSSPYAHFFDIDWHPVKKELTNKVLLPFLADQYGTVLERGELRLLYEQGAFWISNSQPRIPVEPKSYLQVLSFRLEELQRQLPPDSPPLLELLSIITALQHLPPATEQDPERRAERFREKELVKKHLGRLCDESPEIAAFIAGNVAIFNGIKGDARSFDRLDGLLREQVYRLSYWRVATEEINYRRFFDINSLAAIKMEDPVVFRETHRLLFRLIREGKITGLRIDHVDGLNNPLAYLQSLQEQSFVQLRLSEAQAEGLEGGEANERAARSAVEYRDLLAREPAYKPLFLLCEKILMKGEQLPEDWPVHGTTGYEALNHLNGIFVDTENARQFDTLYRRFTGSTIDFPEIVYQMKKLVMQVSLAGEINMLGDMLNTLSEQHRLTRDFTLNSLTRAVAETIACLPVYRTYVNSWTVRDKDVQYIESAISRAKRRNRAISVSTFDFLRSVLLLRFPEYALESDRQDWLAFTMKFQQVSGPVMAKGMEDTSFYIFNRLVSLNDVGGMPARFGIQLDAFHGQNLDRVKFLPHALVTTATHDTKRGEDVRTRIDVLSELPAQWQKSLAAWNRMNRKKCRILDSQAVPDRNEEYLLYQTLVGAWPAEGIDTDSCDSFRIRIREYMLKALREAKVNTSWVSPNAAYEEALLAFIDDILACTPDNAFFRDFIRFQQLVARCGMFSSLSQALLKIAVPGIPDFYQGTELWDLNLVDPDNRRPVDYTLRRKALDELIRRQEQIGPRELTRELLSAWRDGRIKLYLIYRCLNYRRRNRQLFEQGDYQPLEAHGPQARHLCAFARSTGNRVVIAAAARFFAALPYGQDQAKIGSQAWGSTVLALPGTAGRRLRNIVTDEILEAEENGDGPSVPLVRLFAELPVALLEPVPAPRD